MLFHPSRSVPPTARTCRRRSRLALEKLEDRLTPASAITLSSNTLIAFDTGVPGVTQAPVAVTGLNAGDTLVAIDCRPQNGHLYGLGYNSAAGTVQLYHLSQRTGLATTVGTPGTFVAADGTTPVPIQGTSFGFDFNPTVDRLRVVNSSGQNFRMNPNSGAFVDGDLGAATAQPGLNMDGAINGATTVVDAAAYTNNQQNTTVTTQYTLSAVTDTLHIQNPPNAGTQTIPVGLGIDFTNVSGFDIPPGVNVGTSGSQAASAGFAVLTVSGVTALYSIHLSTGVATLVGSIGNGSSAVEGLAVSAEPAAGALPVIALTATNSLERFSSAVPSTTASVNVTGLVAGETLAGFDWRPLTGQLYSLGFNSTNGTGSATLYRLDPQTGAATILGTANGIANGAGTPIALAGATRFGFDFNPAADRVRVVTDNGLNFRINPNDGSVVNAALDGAINGLPAGSTGVVGAAYTNSFGWATATTLYTLDAVSNQLFIQDPPNNGTQTNGVGVTLSGAAFDFEATVGLDIPATVWVSASGAAATGLAFATLRLAGGGTNLYTLNLATGALTLVGQIGSGNTSGGLTLGDVFDPVPVILSATAPSDGPYGAGRDLDFTFTFTESVTVTGTPRVQFTVGASAVFATYQSGSGTTQFVFRYTVQAGDSDSDGIASSSPVQLNGGTMRNAAGADVFLSFTPPNTSGVLVETTAPTLGVTPNGTTTNANPITFTFQFSEAVTGFTAGDVTLTNGTAGTFTAVDADTFTLQVTPTADGTVSVSVAANAAQDAAGNGNTASGPSSCTFDGTAPAVTVNQAASQADPTATGPILFTVVFSETVTGFDGADVNLGGTAGATTAVVTGSGTTYTVSVSGMTQNGTVTVTLAVGAAADAAGNASLGATSTDNSVTFNVATGGIVSGVVFNDLDNDGIRDNGEPTHAGLTVWLDLNDNGVLDAGEPFVLSDANGAYSLAAATDGTYAVRQVLPAGWEQTAPAGGGFNAVLTAGAILTSRDFADVPALTIILVLPTAEIYPANAADVNTALVVGLYRTLLGRDPEPAGQAGFVALLNQGFTQQQVAEFIWESPEHRVLQVDSYYRSYLDREADPTGRASWVGFLLAGASEQDVVLGFLTSTEYQASHASDAGYVGSLYTNLLNRTPSVSEAAGWLQALQSGATRADVVEAFLSSDELFTQAIEAFYSVYLHRAADAAGLALWLLEPRTGRSLENIGVGFLGSTEFLANAQQAVP